MSKIKKFFSNIKRKYQKKIVNNHKCFSVKELVVTILITLGLGIVIGGIIMYAKGPLGFASKGFVNEFLSTYNDIANSYYQDIDKEELLSSGINGMIKYLGDPYAGYLTEDDAKDFSEDVDGSYSGIGAEIKLKDDQILIGKVFDDSPAQKVGILTDDVLLEVNGESVKGKSLNAISSIVKGETGTEVNIKVLRDKQEYEFTIKRGTVDTISVTSELIEKESKKIGYLHISIFAANTFKQFEKELLKLEEEKIDSLIIDVRGNSGGYLTTVSDIISIFIQKGLPIYQLKTKEKIEIVYDKTKDERKYPIIVLADSASASASELLVGALKETYGAQIVGTKTFGKGKVQKVYSLSNGSMVKYTYQEWLTPRGNYIDGKGITPDEEIKYVYNKDGEDNQLEYALKLILNK